MVVRSKPVNVTLFKQRLKELEGAGNGQDDEFFLRVGKVTNGFEYSENLLSYVLNRMDRRSHFVSLTFDTINSRQTRSQIIREFLAVIKPKRVTKHYQRVLAAFESYDALGKQRDEVAHCFVTGWTINGKTVRFLCPPHHIDRKHVGGIPKFHYDIPKLDKLIANLDALQQELGILMVAKAIAAEKRRARRERRQDARTLER